MSDEPFNFLRKFSYLLRDTEVPERFSIWAGISAISAVLERKVWMSSRIGVIYPNMYIVLIGESGRARKSTSIVLERKLLRRADVGLKILPQKTTAEALINSLKSVETKDPKILLKETCGGLVIAEEFMTFLNRKSYDGGLSQVLIPFWDCDDKFQYQTMARGVEEVNYGYLGIAAAATPQSLREALPINVIGEGLTSRIIFVYSDAQPKPCAWPEISPEDRAIEEELVRYLQMIYSMEGGLLTLSPEAKEWYIHEYDRFFTTSPLFDHPQARPYASRRHVHLLKLSIAIMFAENPQRTIHRHHLEGAKYLLESSVDDHLTQVFDSILTTEKGDTTRRILTAIKSSGPEGIMRTDLMRKFSHTLDKQDILKVLDTLIMSGQIKSVSRAGGIAYIVKEP